MTMQTGERPYMDIDTGSMRHRFTDLNMLSLSLRLGNFTSDIVGWGFIEPRWWRNYLHVHSFFEVCYAFRGRGTFQMLGTAYEVRAGDVFVAKPGEPHEIISSEDDPLGIYYWSYTLAPGREHQPDDDADALLALFAQSKRWVSRHAVGMERTLELLTEEITCRQPAFIPAIEGLIVKLLLDTARAVIDAPLPVPTIDPPARSTRDATVQSIVRYLRDNYRRSLSIRDVAAQIHLSERHTSRLFAAVMGVSVMDYVTALRMETAAHMLLDHHQAIKEIALGIGYPDVRYFTTVFRQHTGMTPAAFRRERGTRMLDTSKDSPE